MCKIFTVHLDDQLGPIFILAIGVAFIVFLIHSTISIKKEQKQKLKELEMPYEEPHLTEINARVLKKYCLTQSYGTKMPETVNEFYVVFLTESGDELKYKVIEQDYISIDENSTGTLAIVNENFYGFCPD